MVAGRRESSARAVVTVTEKTSRTAAQTSRFQGYMAAATPGRPRVAGQATTGPSRAVLSVRRRRLGKRVLGGGPIPCSPGPATICPGAVDNDRLADGSIQLVLGFHSP